MVAVIDSPGGMEKQFRSLTCERRLFDWMKKHSYDDNLHVRFRNTVHINQNTHWRDQQKEALMNLHLRSEKVDAATTLSSTKMCRLSLIRQGVALAFMVFATAAFSGDFKSGPLGAVEIKRGQPIEIHLLLSDTVVPSVSSAIRTAIEIAIKDFGSIHGRQVFIEAHDELCSGEGGRAVAEAVVADAQVVGVIGTLCSGAAVEASPVISEAGPVDDIAVQHVTRTNVRPVRNCRS